MTMPRSVDAADIGWDEVMAIYEDAGWFSSYRDDRAVLIASIVYDTELVSYDIRRRLASIAAAANIHKRASP